MRTIDEREEDIMEENRKQLTDDELDEISGGWAVKNEVTTIEVYCIGGDFSKSFTHPSKEICEDNARNYMREKHGKCERCGKLLRKRDSNRHQMI